MDVMIEQSRDQIKAIAKSRRIRSVRLFGSFARGDFDESSDVDLIVELDEGASGFDVGGFLMDIQDLLHRKVDVVTEASIHPSIRSQVIEEAILL